MFRECSSGLYELMRPMNAVAAGLLTLIGAFVATGDPVDMTIVVAGVVTVTATAAGNVVNDYFDRDIDRVTNPTRPIPRGAVSPKVALIWGSVLFALTLGLGYYLPPLAWGVLIAISGLLLVYTPVLKGTPGGGNIAVAILCGGTFIFGGLAAGAVEPTIPLALLAGLATFSRELIKDVEDMEGDSQERLATLPLVVGETIALRIAALAIVGCLIAVWVPYWQGLFGDVYLVAVTPGVLLIVGAMGRAFSDPASGQKYMKLGMSLAALSFVVGRLAETGII